MASSHPWKDFPFAGLVTLLGALLALFVDVTASAHMEHHHGQTTNYLPVGSSSTVVFDELGKNVALELENGVVDKERDVDEDEMMLKIKQRLVSQVLEIGIIFHSVIIGVTMGMSQNQCTIKPLVAALSFHQVFEGMGLGGCIAQVFNFCNFIQIQGQFKTFNICHVMFCFSCKSRLVRLIWPLVKNLIFVDRQV